MSPATRDPEMRPKSRRDPAVEPWMSGTLRDLHPVIAALLYSFEHARANLESWTADLSTEELSRTVLGLAPVSFHIRHITGSIDRLLTYALGQQLSGDQLSALRDEIEVGKSRDELMKILNDGLERAAAIVRRIDPGSFADTREIGRNRVPVPLATLLVHIAEHTQRHVGQAIVTAKVVLHSR